MDICSTNVYVKTGKLFCGNAPCHETFSRRWWKINFKVGAFYFVLSREWESLVGGQGATTMASIVLSLYSFIKSYKLAIFLMLLIRHLLEVDLK